MGLPNDGVVLLAPNENAFDGNALCAGFDVVDSGVADGKIFEPKAAGAAVVFNDGADAPN